MVDEEIKELDTHADSNTSRSSVEDLSRRISRQDADCPHAEEKDVVEPPPDGGYGWVCVACVFMINTHTWGINSSYGVFLAFYLANNYYPGASALEFAFIGGLSISQALMISPLATYITRVYGTRTTLLLGVSLETLALIGASFTHQVWQLFLSQGLCFGFGMGLLFVGSVGIVPQWFTKKRSLANGISTAGSGLGGMMYSLATNAMIESLGVEWAFRILGILACGVNVVCALLIRDRNKAVGAVQLAFDYTLFKRPEFWLLLGWGFFSMMGYITLLFSLPNYAVSIGLSSHQGSIIGALLNLGQGLGRPLVGIFSDQAGRINLAGLCTFIGGLFCFVIWIFAKSFGVLIFFAVVVGTVAGTFWTTIAPVSAEVVGLKELPSALSIVWIFLVIPTTFSEPVALELRQQSGNIYLHAQIFTGFMYLAAALSREQQEEQGDSEEKSSEEEKVAVSRPSKSNIVKRSMRWKKV
ncbi:hypothetical protein ACLMJK_004068 [Lecanora helva]